MQERTTTPRQETVRDETAITTSPIELTKDLGWLLTRPDGLTDEEYAELASSLTFWLEGYSAGIEMGREIERRRAGSATERARQSGYDDGYDDGRSVTLADLGRGDRA